MRSTRRHGVWIALASIVASIALVVWWASAQTDVNEAGADGENASQSEPLEHSRAELESSELGGTRTTAASRMSAAAAATNALPDAADRPPGQIRLRLVDAQGQRLTRLKGFLGIERDPLTRVTSGPAVRPASRVDPSGDSLPRRAWNVPIPDTGEYVFEGLEFGKWNVDCQADGFRQVSADVFLFDATPRQEIELVLARQRTLEVSFRTPDGEPFLAALKRAFPRYGDAVRPQLSRAGDTSTSGFVAFTAERGPARDATYWRTLHAASLEDLTVSAFVADTLLASVDVPAGVDEVTLVASVDAVKSALGPLTVVVVEQENERPIAHASVTCVESGFPFPSQFTDADGRVEFAAVLGPTVNVTAECDGRASTSQDVALTARTRTETIVRLERGVSIAGALRATGWRPMFDYISLASFGPGASAGELSKQRARLNGDGFTFTNLPRGEYVVFTSTALSSEGVYLRESLQLPEAPGSAAQRGKLPHGVTYVDARQGSVSNVVLDVSPEAPK